MADGISEGTVEEIVQLREQLRARDRLIWNIVACNDGYTLERHDLENYPGDHRAELEQHTDAHGNIHFKAITK